MRVYLAGPMSYVPSFNIPVFDAAADDLRKRGFFVVSPAELDDPETVARCLASPDGVPTPADETWGDSLARDVKIIADDGIEAVYVLPGWQDSPGALLETFVASSLLGLPVVDYATMKIVPRVLLLEAWAVRPIRRRAA